MTIGLKCDGDTPRVASTQKQAFRNALDTDTFDRCLATGAAMDTAEAVRYARTRIEAV